MCYALLTPVLYSLNCSFLKKIASKHIVINLCIGLLFALMPDSD